MSHPTHIYCLNLKRRPDRWRRMRQRLARRGLRAERYLGFDGATLNVTLIPRSLLVRDYDTTRIAQWAPPVEPHASREMSRGEVACALSHVAIWDDINVRKRRHALVIEDDVEFVQDFVRRISAVLENLPRDWDICYLGYAVWDAPPPRVTHSGLGIPTYIFGTYGYLVSASGVVRLLESLPVTSPLDDFISSCFPNLNVFCVGRPFIVPQRESMEDSNIVHSAFRSLQYPAATSRSERQGIKTREET